MEKTFSIFLHHTMVRSMIDPHDHKTLEHTDHDLPPN